MLPLGPDWKGGVTVTVEAYSYAPRSELGQAVTVLVGGQPLARWDVSAQHNDRFAVAVPRDLWTGSTVFMELVIPGALSPHAAEGSPDGRTLGIAVHAISVHANAP